MLTDSNSHGHGKAMIDRHNQIFTVTTTTTTS
jgi:hypothetical protein